MGRMVEAIEAGRCSRREEGKKEDAAGLTSSDRTVALDTCVCDELLEKVSTWLQKSPWPLRDLDSVAAAALGR